MESPAGAKGSFYNTLGSTGSDYIAVEDNEGLTPDGSLVSHDKEFIVADTFASSPNKNNVYVTWTVFYFDPDTGEYRQSPIFGSSAIRSRTPTTSMRATSRRARIR